MKTLQKFSSVHAEVHNAIYEQRRSAALAEWRALVA